ncbi:YSIRK-type signal peptide-containing protein [Streptococcus parauberis]|uniref:Putative immunoglobulin G-binding protein G n=1 Tax=Streptococcus parauberis NCFD 2020 TaxID=873447 RepID=F1Z231_9STRE|nr:YSIRK-type signal peptide-containing protein [Streptococcus parauberis]EGE53925.1 putative immunoglobulin G-binding protein G [Streptococcus parauberis NCFD 2020]
MKENKQMKYFLRKSIFGLASVSAAFIVGGSFVSADEATIINPDSEIEKLNLDTDDKEMYKNDLLYYKSDKEAINSILLDAKGDSAKNEIKKLKLDADIQNKYFDEIDEIIKKGQDSESIKKIVENATTESNATTELLKNTEVDSYKNISDAEWLKAAEDAEKSKISEDEDQTTEDAEEDDVETVSEESDAEADVNAEEDMEDEEDEDEVDEDEVEDEDENEDEEEDSVDENEDEEDSVDENEGNNEDPKINITPSPKEKETKESRQAMRDKLMAETKEREAKAAKERLEKERSTALTELDHLGAGRLLKNIVSTAKTVEGIKEFMAITRPSLEHAMKVKATSGLTDFLKSQRSAEDTVKDIILTNAKNAALKKLEKLGATDHLKELVENAKTVEDIRTLMAEATPSLEATLSKEEADQVAPEVSEEAPMGSENPMPEGVETDTESSEILNTDKDVERQATGKSVLADTEGKASAPFVQTDAKKPAMEATKEKTPVKAEETKKADQHLPVTGEKVNPFFTGVALSIIASAGMVAYSTKRKEN